MVILLSTGALSHLARKEHLAIADAVAPAQQDQWRRGVGWSICLLIPFKNLRECCS